MINGTEGWGLGGETECSTGDKAFHMKVSRWHMAFHFQPVKVPHVSHTASALCWTWSIHTRHFCRATCLPSGLSANLNWDKMIKSCSSFRRSKCYQAEPIKYWQWDVSSRIVRLRMRNSRFFHNVTPPEIVFFGKCASQLATMSNWLPAGFVQSEMWYASSS